MNFGTTTCNLCTKIKQNYVIWTLIVLLYTLKLDDFYKDINNDVNIWFHTSNYSKDINRPLEKGKNKKVIGKFKDELRGLIMSEFCAHRAKTYAFLTD